MPEFRRKTNRLSAETYRGRRAYFLTLCVRDRKTVFSDGTLVNALLTLLERTCAAHSFNVYAFCFMPDHLHLVLVGESESSELATLIQVFKGAATAVARKSGISNLWQKGFYDHVLRSGKSLDESAWYIFSNPVRAGLAKTVQEWPYSGSFVFEWKSLALTAQTEGMTVGGMHQATLLADFSRSSWIRVWQGLDCFAAMRRSWRSVAPPALGDLPTTYPALTRWANVWRAYDASGPDSAESRGYGANRDRVK